MSLLDLPATDKDIATKIARLPKRFRRGEDGSLTIFCLFMFILLLMMSGMAVDMAMHERQRVHMQNTLDSAILAAGSLDSGATTEAEMEAMVLDYVAKAGIDPNRVSVTPKITGASSRTISATGSFEIDTIFMGLMGIDEVPGGVGGAAAVGEEKVEIVLVLDVSGSMGRDGKIEALRPAAKGFVTEIITKLGADRVAFSIVPYNHQVHIDDDLRSRLHWDDAPRHVLPADVAPYPGAITTYSELNPSTRCARFRDADFRTITLTDTPEVEGSAVFSGYSGDGQTAYASYPSWAAWCSDTYSRVLLYQNDETSLHTYIDSLQGQGWTSIDYGMNWGVGILGTEFTPIVQDMVDNNILHPDMAGHPYAFTEPDVKKIIVLMTDGINTAHLDLDDDFKSGPSRIWYSDTLANGSEYMGFLVEMPGNATNQRWFVPGSPLSTADDSYLAESALPSDAVQWDYHKVYDRFRPQDVGPYFFVNDAAEAARHNQARVDVGSNGIADTRVRNICTEARAGGIDIYTIAFQAPTASETLLRDCAARAGRYFDVNGLDIANAFNAIAVDLTRLKLTQ